MTYQIGKNNETNKTLFETHNDELKNHNAKYLPGRAMNIIYKCNNVYHNGSD